MKSLAYIAASNFISLLLSFCISSLLRLTSPLTYRGLAKIGLGWHGGKVARFEGEWEDARVLFKQFGANGEVSKLPSWGIA